MRRQQDLANAMRRDIVRGRYRAGARIPSMRELVARTGAGLPTVHRALAELAAQGFLVSDGRHGTRVVDHPPHVCRFGLVLPEEPGQAGGYANRLLAAMAASAVAISRPQRTVAIYHGLNQHRELPAHRHLLDDCASRRLAGVMVHDPDRISAWFDVRRCGVPTIGREGSGATRGAVILDQWEVAVEALRVAAAARRRRVALLTDGGAHTVGYLPGLRGEAASLGLDLPSRRIVCAPLSCPAWATQAVAGVWDQPGAPPQALIILDDNLIEAALAGLRTVGADALVVHLANWPAPPTAWPHSVGLGWDHREVLSLALDRLSASGAGDAPFRVPLRRSPDP